MLIGLVCSLALFVCVQVTGKCDHLDIVCKRLVAAKEAADKITMGVADMDTAFIGASAKEVKREKLRVVQLKSQDSAKRRRVVQFKDGSVVAPAAGNAASVVAVQAKAGAAPPIVTR
jgi:hypothetical protein